MGRKKCNLETSQTEMCIGMKEECDPAEIATTNDVSEVPYLLLIITLAILYI